ncbi:hypothetical protein Bhyg_00906 [Pseudolycoriella hygida]|uniref:Uncharacterized protein n=1 Tax=Pseudolycoriella hygida TaxID=35572 RepID=A0A9Q0S6B9_9DIPT|nr:hypothetical protein Bhyg_00906 [Pseudolycoriella hygida]
MKKAFIAILLSFSTLIFACDEPFEAFGVHLGSIDHFSASPEGTVEKVIEKVYNDLKVRHFRTSYESTFSPKEDTYEIVCGSDARICSWIESLKILSDYPEISVMASIWSPPHYMKTQIATLPKSQEQNFHYFISNVTKLIKDQFGIEIERISPVNEPENIFAGWEHLNMLPDQLCRMVNDFNDSTIAICPENSYITTSLIYSQASTPACLESCKIFGTHAYDLVFDNFTLRANYDLKARDRTIPSSIPIWQTEVSTTISTATANEMRDALDLAINVVNFVGHTCVQRYYYWLSYTLNPSGESLIWGNSEGVLKFPKKYFAYRHFTLASQKGNKEIEKYDPVSGVTYLIFGQSNAVFVNNLDSTQTINFEKNRYECSTLFCTTISYDWNQQLQTTKIALPAESVCSCTLEYTRLEL